MRLFVTVFLACLAPALCAQEPEAPPKLLVDAGHCLASSLGDPLALSARHATEAELGYVVAGKSLNSGILLTVVNYTITTHARGTVFTFVVHGSEAHPILHFEYSIGFRQSDDGLQKITLVDPPFGGIATQDQALSAIRQIGFRTYPIPVAALLAPSKSVRCESQPSLP